MTTSRRFVVVVVVFAVALAGCAQLMADSLEALLKQGLELLAAQKYDAAAAKFLEVVRRDPKSWDGYVGLTRAYLGKGSWADAIASGRKALALAPDRSEVTAALADALLGAGTEAVQQRRFSDAAGHLVEYVKLRPADVQGYLQLGRAFLGTGAFTDSLRAFGQGLAQNPDAGVRQQLVRGLLDGGSQALGAGKAGAAVDFLREYVRYDPGSVSAYLDLGRAYWQSGQLGNAFTAFQHVLELNPTNTEALQFLRGNR